MVYLESEQPLSQLSQKTLLFASLHIRGVKGDPLHWVHCVGARKGGGWSWTGLDVLRRGWRWEGAREGVVLGALKPTGSLGLGMGGGWFAGGVL